MINFPDVHTYLSIGHTNFQKDPKIGLDPECISSVDWPEIESPTDFNRYFDRPFKIRKVAGGYFGASDGCEWRGGLFFATRDAPTMTEHIIQMSVMGVVITVNGLVIGYCFRIRRCFDSEDGSGGECSAQGIEG